MILYSDISPNLTCNTLDLNVNSVLNETSFDKDMSKKIIAYNRKFTPSRKSYIQFEISLSGIFHKTLALLDCGSDCNLLRSDTVFDLFKHEKSLLMSKLKEVPITVTGFAGQSSKVLGQITFNLRFSNTGKVMPVIFYVVDKKVKNSPCGILGYSAWTYLDLVLTKYVSNGKVYPDVYRRLTDRYEFIDHYYLSESEIFGVQQHIQLKANEVEQFSLKLNDYPVHIEEDQVLVDSTFNIKNIGVAPTRSLITKKNGNFYVQTTIKNFSNVDFSGEIEFMYHKLDDFDVKPISRDTIEELCSYRILSEVLLLDSSVEVTQPHDLFLDSSHIGNMFQFEIDSHTISVITTEPYTEPTLESNIVTIPTFPEKDLGFNPRSLNNDVSGDKSLSEERANMKVSKEYREFPEEDTINLSMKDPDPLIANDSSGGFSIPKKGFEKIGPADILKLENHRPEIRPYLKKIFLEDHPNVISKHAYDLGKISKYLGFYKLKLKEGAQLPTHQKLYYLSNEETLHLKDILRFLEGYGIISRVPTEGAPIKFACSSYLIPKKSGQDHSRLIIDAVPLNRVTMAETPIIPSAQTLLNDLSNKHFYSNFDLRGAFNSIEIAPESRKFTCFLTPLGQYITNTLTTGQISSPGALSNHVSTMLEFKLARDEKGEVLWDNKEKQVAKLEREPVESVGFFYDDLISGSNFYKTFEESMRIHFEIVAKLIARLDEFCCKISIEKSNFFKAHIKFLGWSICNSYIYPDQNRLKAILDFPRPTTVKQWRSFAGSVSSIRTTCNFEILKNVSILTDLCSDKADHMNPTEEQISAFEEIKKLLISAPLFTTLIQTDSAKIVYSDANSLSQSAIPTAGAILAQCVEPKHAISRVPRYLYLDDPCHVIINKCDLKCCPVRYLRKDENPKDYVKNVGPLFPPEVSYLSKDDFELGEDLPNSLVLSLKSLYVLHNMNISDENFAKFFGKLHKFVKKDIIGHQIKTFEFSDSKDKYRNYLDNLVKGQILIDKNYYIFEALAFVLSRPILVISSLDKDKDNPVRTFRSELQRCPFFFLIYEVSNTLVSKLAYVDKNLMFDLATFKGAFEVCCYWTKKIPASLHNLHIYDLEILALILALESFSKLIGHSELLVVSDSLCLYYLMNRTIQASSEKLQRWSAKIYAMFPQMKIAFVKSNHNLADILTRQYNVKPTHMRLSGLERMSSMIDDKLYDELANKTFSLDEFQEFCTKHPEFLILPDSAKHKRIENPELTTLSLDTLGLNDSISVTPQSDNTLFLNELSSDLNMARCIKHYVNISESLNVLKERINHEQFSNSQQVEFRELYENIVTSPNMIHIENGIEYYFKNGLIFRKSENLTSQCLVPKSLLNVLVAYYHLTTSHGGLNRMMTALEPYFSVGLRKKVTEFLKTCLNCVLNNYSTTAQIYSYFPVSNKPFQHVHLDMMEGLDDCNGYTSLLICVDAFSLASFAFPMKNQTKSEFYTIFSYGIFQFFKPEYIHCDNSRTFINEATLEIFGAYGIRVVHTVANSPKSHGLCEAVIKIYKTAVRKFILGQPTSDWVLLLPLISINLNSQTHPKHKMTPYEILFGAGKLNEGLDSVLGTSPILHPLIKMSEQEIDEKRQEWASILDEVSNMMNDAKVEFNRKINKGKVQREYYEGQIVFLKRVSPRGFETIYETSIFKVVQEKISTLLIMRISDGVILLAHKDHCKIFSPDLELFNILPQEIKNLCIQLKDVDSIDRDAYHLVMRYDKFEVPEYLVQLIGEDPMDTLNREFSNTPSSEDESDRSDSPVPGPSNR